MAPLHGNPRVDGRGAPGVAFRQDRRDRGAVHLAVDLLREAARLGRERHAAADEDRGRQRAMTRTAALLLLRLLGGAADFRARRSEEHTSELQSLMRISYAGFCLTKHTTPHS